MIFFIYDIGQFVPLLCVGFFVWLGYFVLFMFLRCCAKSCYFFLLFAPATRVFHLYVHGIPCFIATCMCLWYHFDCLLWQVIGENDIKLVLEYNSNSLYVTGQLLLTLLCFLHFPLIVWSVSVTLLASCQVLLLWCGKWTRRAGSGMRCSNITSHTHL